MSSDQIQPATLETRCHHCNIFSIKVTRQWVHGPSRALVAFIAIAFWAFWLTVPEPKADFLRGGVIIVIIGAIFIEALHHFNFRIRPWIARQQICFSEDVNGEPHVHHDDEYFNSGNGLSAAPTLNITKTGSSTSVSRDGCSHITVPLGFDKRIDIIGPIGRKWEIKRQGLNLVFQTARANDAATHVIPILRWARHSESGACQQSLIVINRDRVAKFMKLAENFDSLDALLAAASQSEEAPIAGSVNQPG